MSAKNAYEQKLQAKLDEWKADIDKLSAKAEQAEADTKLEYQKQVEDLKKRREDMRERLGELKKSGDSAWEDVKAGIENAWTSLEDAMRKATQRFK